MFGCSEGSLVGEDWDLLCVVSTFIFYHKQDRNMQKKLACFKFKSYICYVLHKYQAEHKPKCEDLGIAGSRMKSCLQPIIGFYIYYVVVP